MSSTAGQLRPPPSTASWRTPLIVIVCGCAIALLSFGPRSALGFFVQPMSHEFAWGRDVFGLALAVQNLLRASVSRLRVPSPIVSARSA